jgi:hypothetical protein
MAKYLKGQSGNEGNVKPKRFADALHRAIVQDDGNKLRLAAVSLLDQAAAGEGWAIKELADRLDGKSVQAIAGDKDQPLVLQILKFADAHPSS